MEVLNQRSALLSNYEVLALLKELENDHLARTKTAIRIKKEEEAAGLPPKQPADDISENLRTVEVEAIQYLSADYQPTAAQSEREIATLTRTLGQWDLTKTEKLQIVNLAPTEAVELYVIVEELEDRFGEKMDDILAAVKSSLSEPAAVINGAPSDEGSAQAMQVETTYAEYTEDYAQGAEHWEYDANEVVFDDTGEGAGIEGDLDVDDD